MPDNCGINFGFDGNSTLLVSLSGRWEISADLPEAGAVFKELEANRRIARIGFDSTKLTFWDSSLLTFLVNIFRKTSSDNIRIDPDGLPDGIQRLVHLALAVPPKKDTVADKKGPAVLERLGLGILSWLSAAGEILGFTGETFLALLRFLRGRASFRRSDLFLFIQDCGALALPIVTLISLLVGLILAFVGAVQLQMFGAQIYVANLVGLGMAREMGAMMTGIIMAGRTGAAFAAQLGSMQVNEEIDALKTLGVAPMEFLVLPRMTALVLMMPLLCLYAVFMGILGGMLVGVGMLDITFAQYYEQTRAAIDMTDISLGLIKSVVFGVIVAMSGCLRGMQSGRSSSAVGDAATSAVVTGIVGIVVSDATLTVIYSILGI
jgi:phospholipid/cholesterol/gamma-HCH transport system permease protein